MLGLRDFREHAGLTLSGFARRLGLSPSLVCRIERGREAPYPKFRRKAAEVLGVPEEVLFRGVGLAARVRGPTESPPTARGGKETRR